MAQSPVVNEKDKQWGIIVAVLTIVLLAMYLLLASFQFADPPPKDIPLTTEMSLDELVMDNLKVEAGGGAGGGSPSDAPISKPKPEVEEVITNADSKVTVRTGKSNKTNTKQNTDNEPTTPVKGSSPFTGKGKEEDGGQGPFKGIDNGVEGQGQGTTSGAGRTRYNEISTDAIYTSVEVIVKLKMTINEDGQVVTATRIEGTTTTDQRIINQVISAVKAQLKYSKKPCAGIQFVYYTAKILPN